MRGPKPRRPGPRRCRARPTWSGPGQRSPAGFTARRWSNRPRSGKFAAAGLDVYKNEPDIHPGFAALDNVFLLPHVGSATKETRDAMG